MERQPDGLSDGRSCRWPSSRRSSRHPAIRRGWRRRGRSPGGSRRVELTGPPAHLVGHGVGRAERQARTPGAISRHRGHQRRRRVEVAGVERGCWRAGPCRTAAPLRPGVSRSSSIRSTNRSSTAASASSGPLVDTSASVRAANASRPARARWRRRRGCRRSRAPATGSGSAARTQPVGAAVVATRAGRAGCRSCRGSSTSSRPRASTTKPLCIQWLANRRPRATAWARSFSWCGKRRSMPAAVEVEALAEQVEGHHHALGVPARAARAPRRRPRRLARLGQLPQGEVGRSALRVGADHLAIAAAGAHVVERLVGQQAVVRHRRDRQVDAVGGLVGPADVDQLADHRHHLRRRRRWRGACRRAGRRRCRPWPPTTPLRTGRRSRASRGPRRWPGR